MSETLAALAFGMIVAVALFFPVIAYQLLKLIGRLANE